MPSNADIIRASYAAFRAGDIDAALAAFAPDIEWTHPDGMNDFGLGGTKKGHDEVRAFMAHARSLFSELRPEPSEFLESGDRVVVLGTHHMRGARTGLATTVPFVHSWQLSEGKATHFSDLHDTAPVRAVLEPRPSDDLWHIVRTGLAFWDARVLLSAIELDLFTTLGDTALPADELASRLGVHPRGARDFFDALVAMHLLEREGEEYRNTPATARHLDATRPDAYLGGLLGTAGELWYGSWGDLTAALRAGGPTDPGIAGEEDPFEVLYADEDRVEGFQRAMTGGSLGAALTLPERFEWERYSSVVDVGAAGGAVLRRLLAARPHLTGIGFDLKPLEPAFRRASEAAGLADRLTFVAGSFFTDPIPTADVVVLGHVLHDWDLETKRMLLRKAYDALPPGGAVVVYDTVIDDDRRENVFGLLTSLHMLVQSPGGFDYTGAECLDWLADAGFRDCRVRHLDGPESIVVGHKPHPAREDA